MKKIVVLLLTALLAIGLLSGCGGREKPGDAVANALNAVKSLDSEAAQKYFSDESVRVLDESSDEQAAETARLLFSKLEFEVGEVKEEGDAAIVATKITNVDMKEVFREYMKEVFSLAFSDLSEEEMDQKAEELMETLLQREDNPMATNSVDITMNYVDDGWKIEMSGDLMNALLGGLQEIADGFGGAAE